MFHFEVLLHDAVSGVRDVVHHDVQVDLVWFVSIGVERLPHFNTVRVVEHFQNLELSVLVALVLEDFLDGDGLAGFRNDCFEHNTKGAISNDFLRVVSKTLLKRVG